jgi:hypothetical protein
VSVFSEKEGMEWGEEQEQNSRNSFSDDLLGCFDKEYIYIYIYIYIFFFVIRNSLVMSILSLDSTFEWFLQIFCIQLLNSILSIP